MRLTQISDLPEGFSPEDHRYPLGMKDDNKRGWTPGIQEIEGGYLVRAERKVNGVPSCARLLGMPLLPYDPASSASARDVVTSGSVIVYATGPLGEVPTCTAYHLVDD